MANPTVNPVILLSPVEGGYVAYDPAQDNLHQLNPIAALVTELCDGTRSVEEIGALVGPLAPDGEAAGIARWIDEGMKAGLLVWQGSEPATRHELSAAELFKLTKRLREAGKVQPAYLCGKRTVELTPDDWNAWYDLGEIAQCVGKRDEARVAYQKYLDAHPEDGEVEHLLIALNDDRPPPRASDRAIQHIYKNFAASYESRMCEDLKYAGPERLQDGIRVVIGDKAGLTMLDLGCGSGLMGVNTKWRAADLTGVDLSPEMIELARARNIYDRLEVAEITGWLDDGRSSIRHYRQQRLPDLFRRSGKDRDVSGATGSSRAGCSPSRWSGAIASLSISPIPAVTPTIPIMSARLRPKRDLRSLSSTKPSCATSMAKK